MLNKSRKDWPLLKVNYWSPSDRNLYASEAQWVKSTCARRGRVSTEVWRASHFFQLILEKFLWVKRRSRNQACLGFLHQSKTRSNFSVEESLQGEWKQTEAAWQVQRWSHQREDHVLHESPREKADPFLSAPRLPPSLSQRRTCIWQWWGHKCIILPGTALGTGATVLVKRTHFHIVGLGAGRGAALFETGTVLLILFSLPVLHCRKVHWSQLKKAKNPRAVAHPKEETKLWRLLWDDLSGFPIHWKTTRLT